jgi:hypothetical protein
MTHSGGKPHTNVGDRGQRYEVRMTGYPRDGENTLGWSDTIDEAERMLESIMLAPDCVSATVFDRKGQCRVLMLVKTHLVSGARETDHRSMETSMTDHRSMETSMTDHVRWFDPLGACYSCRKPATGTLRGPRNESYGYACQRCADARIKRAEKEREKKS